MIDFITAPFQLDPLGFCNSLDWRAVFSHHRSRQRRSQWLRDGVKYRPQAALWAAPVPDTRNPVAIPSREEGGGGGGGGEPLRRRARHPRRSRSLQERECGDTTTFSAGRTGLLFPGFGSLHWHARYLGRRRRHVIRRTDHGWNQALVNQKTEERQGNPDAIYYRLAASDQATACWPTLSQCVFHDVQSGDIDVNCTGTVGCFLRNSGGRHKRHPVHFHFRGPARLYGKRGMGLCHGNRQRECI